MLKKDRAALTPPMGWNSWDCYGPTANEEQLLANARYMAEHLRPHGWEYIVCDIQWSEPLAGTGAGEYINFATLTLDEYSRQIPAVNRFPSSAGGKGFGPIAKRIHDMGLKFGIHIMRGVPRQAVHAHSPIKGADVTADRIALSNSICRWNTDMYGVDFRAPGAQAYYDSIFALYAEWGVDYVKVDDICNTNAYPDQPYSAQKEIEMIRHAIDVCGRDIVLSLSPGPAVVEKAWHLKHNANMWRITDDFWDKWEALLAMFERCEVWSTHVSPGCWPDCDMLPLGHLCLWTHDDRMTRFTKEEQITLMTLWCIFRSPLMMGGELRGCDEWTLSLLTNDEVLHLLGGSHGADQLARDESHAVWVSADDCDGSRYLAMFNFSAENKAVSVDTDALGLPGGCLIRDLWRRKDLGRSGGSITAEIGPHGAALYKLSRA